MTNEQTYLLQKMVRNGSFKYVGLISDTHVPVRARSLPKKVFQLFQNAHYIIHAGDLVKLSVLDELEQLAPVLAVHGNMDGPDVSGALPKLNTLKIFDWKIGVIHDPGTYFGLGKIRDIVKQNSFDALVYGHTHNSHIKWEGKTLYINPGSATNPAMPFINKPSVAMLKISKDSIIPEIITV